MSDVQKVLSGAWGISDRPCSGDNRTWGKNPQTSTISMLDNINIYDNILIDFENMNFCSVSERKVHINDSQLLIQVVSNSIPWLRNNILMAR